MNCNEFIDKYDELAKLIEDLENEKAFIDMKRTNHLACLVCKNKTQESVVRILSYLRKRIEECPLNAEFLFALARIQNVVNNMSYAEEYYIKAYNLDPLNEDYIERIIRFYALGKNELKINEFASILLNVNPQKAKLINKILFTYYYDTAQYKNSIKFFQLGFDIYESIDYQSLMFVYNQLNKMDEVIFLYNSLDEKNQQCTEIKFELATSYDKLKMFDISVNIYKDLSYANFEKYAVYWANALSNLREFDEAIDKYVKLQSDTKNENYSGILVNYALTLCKKDLQSNSEYAINLCNEALKINPYDNNTHQILALIYDDLGLFLDSARQYMAMINTSGYSEYACREVSICIIKALNVSDDKFSIAQEGIDAINVLQANSQLTGMDFSSLAIFYRFQGKKRESIEATMKSIEVDPNSFYCLHSAGRNLYLLNNYKQALMFYEKAYNIDNNVIEVVNGYFNLLIDAKQDTKALELARGYVKEKDSTESLLLLAMVEYKLKLYNETIATAIQALNFFDFPLSKAIKDEIANILICSCVMSNKDDYLLDLMNDKKYSECFASFDVIKIILYLRKGEFTKAKALHNECDNDKKNHFNFDVMDILISYNCKHVGWEKKCINKMPTININSKELVGFRRDLLFCSAQAYSGCNNPKESIKYYKQLVEVEPSNAINWYFLSIEQLYINEIDRAIDSLERAKLCNNINDILILRYFKEKFGDEKLTTKQELLMVEIFFTIYNKIELLKSNLLYDKHENIYHYTNLEVLNNLVKKDGRLRLSNAAYMNDPIEGTAICVQKLDNIKKLFDNEDKLKPTNIFLLSLCESGDSLPLWVQYGNVGCGCSISFKKNFFDNECNNFFENYYSMNSTSLEFKINVKNAIVRNTSQLNDLKNTLLGNGNYKDLEVNFDATFENVKFQSNFEFLYKLLGIDNPFNSKRKGYSLYKVVYLDECCTPINLNKDKNQTKRALMDLNKQILTCQKEVLSIVDNDKSIVNSFNNVLRDLLLEIRYLFKTKDYMHENEVRVVKGTSLNSEDVKVHHIEHGLGVLYIELDKQIEFNECILGPKVNHPSKISPILYKNNTFSKVKTSKIKYR